MDIKFLSVYDTLWHQILFHLRVDRISTWSKKLEKVPQLDQHILFLVHETPDILMGELCKRLSIPNTTLSSAISRMEKRELIQRVISQKDLRSFGLVITPQGEEIWKEFDKVHAMLTTRLLNYLDGPQEKEALLHIFQKAAKILDPQCSLHPQPGLSQSEIFKDAWIKTLFGIRIDRMESWSEIFNSIGQLELHILNLVNGKPGIMLKEIHEALCIPSSTVTLLVKKLEQKACLEREIIPGDLRAWGLKITQVGMKIIAEQANLNHKLWQQILWSPENENEQEIVLNLFVKIINRMM